MKNKLIKYSFWCGLVPLTFGWLIFIIWVIGRYFFAEKLVLLQVAGFFWTMLSFVIASIGILLLLIYTFKNIKNLKIIVLLPLAIILLNIPSLLFILKKIGDIERKVFVKIKNKTEKDVLMFNIISKHKSWDFMGVNNGNSTIIYYTPAYNNWDGRICAKQDSLQMIITSKNYSSDTIQFPFLGNGTCKHLTIDNNLNIN